LKAANWADQLVVWTVAQKVDTTAGSWAEGSVVARAENSALHWVAWMV
jgi:hypothetical protein